MITFGEGPFDVVVAVAGRSPVNLLQSADIIVGGHASPRAARRWIADVFAEYPGCLAAVSWNAETRVGLFEIREVNR